MKIAQIAAEKAMLVRGYNHYNNDNWSYPLQNHGLALWSQEMSVHILKLANAFV